MSPCGGGRLKAELISKDAVRRQTILSGERTNEDLLPVQASTDIHNWDYDSPVVTYCLISYMFLSRPFAEVMWMIALFVCWKRAAV